MKIMKIIVCSKNPVKIQAVQEAFDEYYDDFEIKGLDLKDNPSVQIQPLSAEQTLQSANKRVEIAQKNEQADFFVSLEGGISKDEFGAFLTWYVNITNNIGKKSIAGGGRMPLPTIVYDKLLQNREKELGEIIDDLADDENTKQKGGASALFTDNRVLRKDVFKRDVIIALVPFTSYLFQKLESSHS